MEEYSSTGDRNLEVLHASSAFTDWMFEQVKPHLRGHILEVGSGMGTYSRYLRKVDRKMVLSEVDPGYLKILPGRFPKNKTVQLDISNPKDVAKLRKHERFDTIIFLNVLEHVKHDEKALKLLTTLLRPGGSIICLVPTHRWLYNTIDKSIGHWRRYTKRELRDKVLRAGYKIDALFSFNIFAIPGWIVNGGIFRKKEVNPQAMRLFNTLVPIFRVIEKYVLFRSIGISTIVVASTQATRARKKASREITG